MGDGRLILIDANIWAYYFDESLSEHTSVIRPVEKALTSQKACVNATVVVETLHYLVKRLGPLVGGRKGTIFTSLDIPIFTLDLETIDVTKSKLCAFSHLGIGGRDATILASMEIENVPIIMTHDQSFKRIPDLHVVDPC
ncbi:MAG: PIN domain-containing protein [Candidatus Lokiarchaeota archaeon]|nr:PIN domain-containing protein [Candidatus Lokiarchaeota archaeon]